MRGGGDARSRIPQAQTKWCRPSWWWHLTGGRPIRAQGMGRAEAAEALGKGNRRNGLDTPSLALYLQCRVGHAGCAVAHSVLALQLQQTRAVTEAIADDCCGGGGGGGGGGGVTKWCFNTDRGGGGSGSGGGVGVGENGCSNRGEGVAAPASA